MVSKEYKTGRRSSAGGQHSGMAAATAITPDTLKLPIDPSAYDLTGDELAFFKTQTGIQNEDELRDHILKVQAEAYAVCH